ncbi:MAG: metal ABC transporter permease [Luteolibacter sp.]
MSAITTAVTAAVMIGMLCGYYGTFVVVRRMALTGDMISHAVLPGVVAGLVWSGTRNPLIVLACAAIAGIAGSLAMRVILAHTRLKPDAALALVLSVFFAIGVALVSMFQPAGAMAFLYGQIAALDGRDLAFLAAVSATTFALAPFVFRSLTMVSFDPAFARILGLPVRAIDTAFYAALTIAIIVAMQAVGVVLVTAMLVTPAAAARFCTPSLARTCTLACAIGAAGALAGVGLSSLQSGAPTGPLIALCLAAAFGVAAMLGPHHGWVRVWSRRAHNRRRIEAEDFLKFLWHREHGSTDKPVVIAAPHTLRKLAADQHIESSPAPSLTATGRDAAAKLVRAHRLWESYLANVADIPPDHVHEEAERAEHWIDEERAREIAERIGTPTTDPHGSPIPPQVDTSEKEAAP